MFPIQVWAFLFHVLTIRLAHCMKHNFLLFLGETRWSELHAENFLERRCTHGVVSEFVNFSFEHVVEDQLCFLGLSGVCVAKMRTGRHDQLGAVRNEGSWETRTIKRL